MTEQIVYVTKQCCLIKNECRSVAKPHCLLKKQCGLEPMSCCNFKKQYDFKPKQCVAGVAGATSLMESDFHATKQINFAANQCCNFKKQGCSAINQCVTVTDRIVFTTEKSVGVTRITRAVRKLSVSVAKKSINDALPVISETELTLLGSMFVCPEPNLSRIFRLRRECQRHRESCTLIHWPHNTALQTDERREDGSG